MKEDPSAKVQQNFIHKTRDSKLLCKPPKKELFELPQSPDCHSSLSSLIALYLQENQELIAIIPPWFFQRILLVQVLDLSHTSIKSLPNSLPKLGALRKLLIRGCQLLMELSPQVGQLEKLEQLDLDETQIMNLPIDIGKLLCLRHLRVSFYPICGKNKSKWKILIHPETISNLSQLTDLCIDVDPADKRWDDSVEVVVKEVCNLKALRTLILYIPELQLLQYMSSIYPSLSRFRFTVGRIRRRIISRVPEEVEAKFRNWDKCFKFVNECDQMRTIIDEEMHCEGNEDDLSVKNVLGSLEYLSIYYMENLEAICRGPTRYGCMSKLKLLGLHTCPQLSIVFSHPLLENLVNLEELLLQDCPLVTSLVSDTYVKPMLSYEFLPSLKRLLLLYLPQLVTISNGLLIAPNLESIAFYNCPKLKRISKSELSSKTLKIIKGECQWWEDIKWNETEWGNRPDYLMRIFSPINNEEEVMTQIAKDGFSFEAKAMIQNESQQQLGRSSGDVYSKRDQQPHKSLAMASDMKKNSHDAAKKKLMREEIERNRRQEMATLYSSLQNLLPPECIKGKRSKSDHLNGAISYIKDLQKRIEKLSARRDELKKLFSNESSPSNVVVRQSLDGLEVVMTNTGIGAQALSLSRVLQLLLEDGLNVVSCISTRIDGGFVHTIQCEANNMKSVDVHIPGLLERKLHEEISSLTQISPPQYICNTLPFARLFSCSKNI
ncbi:hypothetical protein CCACVL1_20158 [Corchorus capsularis]|uniref:BHLH domain-containing protein n=1 Tax=Corchorus capsularis TaxID=210143 RepID=A0A1R3HCB2_COCAP|nr:hypothetical protein CCACVL1_20158 [Corchorus capsularis]